MKSLNSTINKLETEGRRSSLLTSRQSRRENLKLLSAIPALGLGMTGFMSKTHAAIPDCTLAPAMTEGPFWVDENLTQSDITTGTTRASVLDGYPLDLDIYVFNNESSSCGSLPASNVVIDIWHCDAAGEYSGVSGNGQSNTAGQNFLRGNQVTDASGKVRFRTIYPGWYSGRAIHIHLRARVYDQIGNNTYNFSSQLFFDDSISDDILATSPYNTRGTRNTLNNSDNIYRGANSPLDLLLSANTEGGVTGKIAFGLSNLPDSILNNSFAVSTQVGGISSIPTLITTLTISNDDVGTTGNIFVAAQSGDLTYFNDGESWIPYTQEMGDYPAYYTGILNAEHVLTILSGVDITGLGAINFYLGYGASGTEMIQNSRYQLAHSL
ncbi:MAG: hypothetical protein COA96_12030 [SAR86 cluster bacterium]|uniref:Intradiol ring-cleavage dioxygenases domain-containing protein n=1 Tax=SAR86 cluster bacterium TaxID=2030880 RepID=A0A2A5AVU8_9GAMM|nr:MAG: hypothetical protein COA96_12030 [SAR86 cluster bacterium]